MNNFGEKLCAKLDAIHKFCLTTLNDQFNIILRKYQRTANRDSLSLTVLFPDKTTRQKKSK